MEPTQESDPLYGELPSPVTPMPVSEASSPQTPEAAYAEADAGGINSPMTPQPAQNIPVAPPQDQPNPLATGGATTSTPASDDASMIADDADLIEKEWVTRAKTIVEQTKDSPFEQNKEINKVKADYIKKRYNKDLKVSEG